MMKEISGKTPLILKVDESDNQGPLGIRVRSFLETVKMGREKQKKLNVHELQEPYAVKFTKQDKKEKIKFYHFSQNKHDRNKENILQ